MQITDEKWDVWLHQMELHRLAARKTLVANLSDGGSQYATGGNGYSKGNFNQSLRPEHFHFQIFGSAGLHYPGIDPL